MSNLENLKQGYKNFAEGNMEAVLEMWAPDMVWEACHGLPYIKGDGVFEGIPAILDPLYDAPVRLRNLPIPTNTSLATLPTNFV